MYLVISSDDSRASAGLGFEVLSRKKNLSQYVHWKNRFRWNHCLAPPRQGTRLEQLHGPPPQIVLSVTNHVSLNGHRACSCVP